MYKEQIGFLKFIKKKSTPESKVKGNSPKHFSFFNFISLNTSFLTLSLRILVKSLDILLHSTSGIIDSGTMPYLFTSDLKYSKYPPSYIYQTLNILS